MKNITIDDSYLALCESDIASVERQLGISLPDDYKCFLLYRNGGIPCPNLFPIAGDSLNSQGVLARFLCIQEGEYDDLRKITQVYAGRVPANLLPVAYDPGGNLICLSVAGVDQGKVYFWNHEEECEEYESPNYDNIYFVAESFNSLLDSLTEISEDEE